MKFLVSPIHSIGHFSVNFSCFRSIWKYIFGNFRWLNDWLRYQPINPKALRCLFVRCCKKKQKPITIEEALCPTVNSQMIENLLWPLNRETPVGGKEFLLENWAKLEAFGWVFVKNMFWQKILLYWETVQGGKNCLSEKSLFPWDPSCSLLVNLQTILGLSPGPLTVSHTQSKQTRKYYLKSESGQKKDNVKDKYKDNDNDKLSPFPPQGRSQSHTQRADKQENGHSSKDRVFFGCFFCFLCQPLIELLIYNYPGTVAYSAFRMWMIPINNRQQQQKKWQMTISRKQKSIKRGGQ